VLATAELLQDADFSPSVAKAMREKLERLYRLTIQTAQSGGFKKGCSASSLKTIDRWMLSRLQEHVKKATEAMEKLEARKAIHTILFELDQDLQWYQKRARAADKNAKANIIGEVLKTQVLMLTPFRSAYMRRTVGNHGRRRLCLHSAVAKARRNKGEHEG
jgi:leucyl-tRNA synthetase